MTLALHVLALRHAFSLSLPVRILHSLVLCLHNKYLTNVVTEPACVQGLGEPQEGRLRPDLL